MGVTLSGVSLFHPGIGLSFARGQDHIRRLSD